MCVRKIDWKERQRFLCMKKTGVRVPQCWVPPRWPYQCVYRWYVSLLYSFTHSFSKHFLTINPKPGTVPDPEDTDMRWETGEECEGLQTGRTGAARVLNSTLTEADSGKCPRASANGVLLSWLWKKGDSCTCSRQTVCVQTLSFYETPKHIVSPIQKQADGKRENQWQPLLPARVHIFLPAMVHSPPDCVFDTIYIIAPCWICPEAVASLLLIQTTKEAASLSGASAPPSGGDCRGSCGS